LPKGRPLGSFSTWARWCRDPLVALGCCDVAERVTAAKADDPRRRAVLDALAEWWSTHGDRPVRIADLSAPVRCALDPQDRGRQFLASRVAQLAGTQIAGFTLTRSASGARWGAATYALQATDPASADRVAAERLPTLAKDGEAIDSDDDECGFDDVAPQ
jgi:hypothetical protein